MFLYFKDFENLKFLSWDSLCGKGLNVGPNPALKLFKEIVLTSEKSLCLPFKNSDILASLVEHHLELPAGFDRSIAVQPEKIVFFETGGHYQRNFQPSHSSKCNQPLKPFLVQNIKIVQHFYFR